MGALSQISPAIKGADTVTKTKTNTMNTVAPFAIAMSDPGKLPILDKEQLEDLRYLPAVPSTSQGNSEIDSVGSLISLFQTKANERMALMRSSIAQQDWKQLSEVAHSLRGASASMGFPRVALLCKDLELASRQLVTHAGSATNTINQHSSGSNPDALSIQKLSEIFELIQQRYSEADTALSKWLSES